MGGTLSGLTMPAWQGQTMIGGEIKCDMVGRQTRFQPMANRPDGDWVEDPMLRKASSHQDAKTICCLLA
ncbi:MAG: hypothetical protein OXE84_06535 [Rhodobacteraceae bacterium]|nr:hypothetical protein [Paracoccaceae bacterium]MCY4197608.1 hypothetical protein [Paracoccaceae bacterium]